MAAAVMDCGAVTGVWQDLKRDLQSSRLPLQTRSYHLPCTSTKAVNTHQEQVWASL